MDVKQGKPDPLRLINTLNPEVPQAVADVLQKAMAVDRAERYRSAAEMRKELKEAWEQKDNLKWFEFEVVTLDAEGEIKERHRGKNRCYTEDLGDGVVIQLAEIPAGRFLMGAPESEAESEDWERPQHWVNVSRFFMGIYPVTQAQWRAVARLPVVMFNLPSDPSDYKGDNRPVEGVTWEDAVEFCERLSRKTGRAYRLPTEAEWEYACRAGTTTPFHFGETITPEIVNYAGDVPYGSAAKGQRPEETTEVGSFQVANEFGLYDMHGNVWEWCADWYGDYSSEEQTNPTGPSTGTERVCRSGYWVFGAGETRSAARYRQERDWTVEGIGFRLVMTDK